MKELSIVILNWNGADYLRKFLPSVLAHSSDARVIVADNASTDESIDVLREEFPSVEIIQNETNGGFAKGYNDALQKVDSTYYLLLNSDIEVTPNWIEPLMDCMRDEQVAGCQPLVLAYHNKTHFEHAGASGGFLDRNYYPFCRGRMLLHLEENIGQYNDQREIFWATGAAMLIRSKVFHQADGFDEHFFAHMEEIDLCWRIKKQGLKFLVEPKSQVYHVGGGTLPYSSPRKTYLNFRNSLYMLVKNHPGWLFPKLFYRLCLDGIAGFRFLLLGEFAQIKSILKAHGSLYSNFAYLLNERKRIKNNSKFQKVSMIYKGSLLWALYFKRITRFSELNQRLFEKTNR